MPPGMYRTKWKGGMDSGRHNAHDWMDGPQSVGVTNAICIFDALLLEGALIVCHFCHLFVSKLRIQLKLNTALLSTVRVSVRVSQA